MTCHTGKVWTTTKQNINSKTACEMKFIQRAVGYMK